MSPKVQRTVELRLAARGKRIAAAKLWQAARVLRRFDGQELAAVAEVSLIQTKRWLQAMHRYGYVRQAGEQSVALVRDTGPLHPMVRRTGVAWDRNINKEFPCQ